METAMEVNAYNYGANLEVDTTRRSGDVITVGDHISSASHRNELAAEMGTVIGSYIGTIENFDYPSERMVVTVKSRWGTEVGTYRIERKWVEAHLNGEMTMEELTIKVVNTMESEE